MNLAEAFGQFILDARLEKNLNQVQLAKLAGVSRAALWNIEKARACNPGLDTVYRLLTALDKSILEFEMYRVSHKTEDV